MSDPWTERLSEYRDGVLKERDRTELERHLEGCAECRTTLAEIDQVVARAGELEDFGPAVDLWPSIVARIDTRPRGLLARLDSWTSGARVAFTLPQLALGALLLVAISAGSAWWLSPRTAPREAASVPSVAAPGATAYAGLDDAAFARYDGAIADLERVLRDNRAELDTSTVRVIEQNLSLIDRAIDESRRALASDPANSYLNGYLAQQLQRKVRLLQRATGVVVLHQG